MEIEIQRPVGSGDIKYQKWTQKEVFAQLEGIREAGFTNMWGAAIYLPKFFKGMKMDTAEQGLVDWITAYSNRCYQQQKEG